MRQRKSRQTEKFVVSATFTPAERITERPSAAENKENSQRPSERGVGPSLLSLMKTELLVRNYPPTAWRVHKAACQLTFKLR